LVLTNIFGCKLKNWYIFNPVVKYSLSTEFKVRGSD